MAKKKIKVLIVEPEREPRAAEIENDLDAMQEIVDGYIECLPVWGGELVCNEEGELLGLAPNREYCGDVILGTFFLAGTDGDEFDDLSSEAVEHYTELFGLPERGS